MRKKLYYIFTIVIILAMALPISVSANGSGLADVARAFAPDATVTFTLLHTNDFHGTLEEVPASSYPGMARLATAIKGVQTAVGAGNSLLVDGGDMMQGSLLSNITKGAATIDIFNSLGYAASTVGNHEFDWGQTVLQDRATQAVHPFLAANVVSGTCAADNWTSPAFFEPYKIFSAVGTNGGVDVGVIGVTTQETPTITIAEATAGLCFKDPADSIIHYYDQMKAEGADVIVVLSHLGLDDGGYGYGIQVYGDKTLAGKLNTAGKPVNMIVGGHSHTNMASATIVGTTTIAQSRSSSRNLGRADFSVNTDTGAVTINWQRIVINMTDTKDPTIDAEITALASDPGYQTLITEEIGYHEGDLIRNYDGEGTMGDFIQDMLYGALNEDSDTTNDVDIVFNNAGGLRTDIADDNPNGPALLTFGEMFSVLPFGNATAVGTMTGAQIYDLLNQSASLFKGSIQPAGIRFSFYRYAKIIPPASSAYTWAWGAYDITVYDKATETWVPLDLNKTYKVATNEFLAPAGQDGYIQFKYMKNITYWGDMLVQVNDYVKANYGGANHPYIAKTDGRIKRNGNDAVGTIVPITVLANNDSHGRLAKTTSGSSTYQGFTQLATVLKAEKAYNPDHTLVLAGGDMIQGDAMMYYYKSAPTGFAADGTPLPANLQTHPMMAVLNALDYDAMVVGNHEYNFGKDIFTAVLSQAEFPILQANVADTGEYGIADVPVVPYMTKEFSPWLSSPNAVPPIKVAVIGIGNHRVNNYELPSNIPGLTFANPITTAQEQVAALAPTNDLVIALTHIGFTDDPNSVEVDNNVDTFLATQVVDLDGIVGAHSHTNPTSGYGAYKFLPTIVTGPNNAPVIINQAYRYNTNVGELVFGLELDADNTWVVKSKAGRYLPVATSTVEDAAIKAIVDPYVAQLQLYYATPIGQTDIPIDALDAFTTETNGANLQADAAVWKLREEGIDVDFHLSGAMTNKKIANSATPATPYNLSVLDMFDAMPYENSLLVIRMNGPQLKAVLERAYRNYYYYKYFATANPKYGGYSYYTTCMIDTNAGNKITYNDANPALPNGYNVISLEIGGVPVDFTDAETFYNVSTVNYLAAGSCNFNNNGVTLWPLNQTVQDTQYYVRDAVIEYVQNWTATEETPIHPVIEGRLDFKTLTPWLWLPFIGN